MAPIAVGVLTGNPALAAAAAGASSIAQGQSLSKAITSAAFAGAGTYLSANSGSLLSSITNAAPQTAGAISSTVQSVTSGINSLSNTQLLAGAALASGALSSAGSAGTPVRPPAPVAAPERSAAQGLEDALRSTGTGSQATLLTGTLGLGVQDATRGKRRLLGVSA